MTAEVVDRRQTERGELALRRRGPHYDIISNGVFLMSTEGGGSERLLARAALEAAAPAASVLVAGLGVGGTLAEVLADDAVTRVVVVEVEEAVVGWCRGPLAAHCGNALDDPRTTVVVADLLRWLDEAAGGFDAVCVDIDNGPDWTVTDDNAALYSDAGIGRLARLVRPDGALAIWSAAESPELVRRLRQRFARVVSHAVPVARGGPDQVVVASRLRA